ncbi:hypothetical protein PL71_15655 [Pseudoalteromonas distincta]|nr:hypothetical protein PL71_15655 [Pseudoalteromonas elyakovii]KID36388.1 hypothetical protein QT16_13920 [Pseudoalteromonas distincta]
MQKAFVDPAITLKKPIAACFRSMNLVHAQKIHGFPLNDSRSKQKYLVFEITTFQFNKFIENTSCITWYRK